MSLPRPCPQEEGVAQQRHSHFPPGLLEDGRYFVTAIFQAAQQFMKNGSGKGVELASAFSSEEQSAWDLVCERVQALSNKVSMCTHLFFLTRQFL